MTWQIRVMIRTRMIDQRLELNRRRGTIRSLRHGLRLVAQLEDFRQGDDGWKSS